mgnify:FL=1
MNEIYGIVPPITTPFTAEGQVDEVALKEDIHYLIEVAGVHGLAVCGSTGEGHTLTTDETYRITACAVDESKGRTPVITGIITDSTQSAVERGQAVAELGIKALQVTPVHYLFRPSDDAMIQHFAKITEETGLPVIIYNVIPWTYLSPQLLTRIITEVEGVIGVKQSAGDMKLLADLLLLLGNRGRIMSAVDALLYPSFLLGAHGAIAAILTAAPKLCVQLWEAVENGDYETAKSLHELLLPVWNAISDDNLPANVKYVMQLQGRASGKPRLPMPETEQHQKEIIKKALLNASLI